MNYKNILILFSIAIFASCEAPQHKTKSDTSLISNQALDSSVKAAENLESIIKSNINRKPRVDTIFLGFTFGMTTAEVEKHFNELVKTKRLIYNQPNKRYEYPLTLKYFTESAAISPEYFHKKLYRMNLIVSSDDPRSTEESVFVFTTTMYEDKYGAFNFFIEPSFITGGDKTYHWVKNNLHIMIFKNTEGTIVSYIDLPTIQLVEKEKKDTTEKTKNDI